MNPKPLSEISHDKLQAVGWVCTDLDDTLTTRHRMTAKTYEALEELRKNFIKVVIVTGRPAGWVDQIIRLWPVDAVVGENGALAATLENNTPKWFYVADPQTRKSQQGKLEAIWDEIEKKLPHVKKAQDQAFRYFDLAVDIAEDCDRLPDHEVKKILDIFKSHGATAKLSSIHVNGWFGSHSKWDGLKMLFHEKWSVDLEQKTEQVIYVGDSPNDEPLFEKFPLSVGVANIQSYLEQMKFHPGYITQAAEGGGFCELVEAIKKPPKES